jgi:hypothetical protein
VSPRLAGTVAGVALACGGLALLDPCLESLALPAGALAGVGLIRGRGAARLAALLALAWAVAAIVGPDMPADSWNYFAWLHSMGFDADLDLRNQWVALGLNRWTNPGLSNPFSIGPALTWSPFYLLAHAWVAIGPLLGHDVHAPDGLSAPYVRAAALGTLAALVLSGAWLTRSLARLLDSRTAALAVSAAVLGSPVAYYALLAPGMSHGLACAAAATTLALWLETREAPTPARWALLGASLGWLALCRWQAAVFGLLPATLALEQWRQGRLRGRWLLAAGACFAAALLPQLVAWRAIYGRFVTLPQGSGYLDWSSPRLLDVLVSADHGLLLTPVVPLGLLGLVLRGVVPATLRYSGLVVFAMVAWTNGSVSDASGSDAVGARRFAFLVPLAAVGLLELLRRAADLLRRHPLLAPAIGLGGLVLWNLGLVRMAADGHYRETPVPLEDLAGDQARTLRELTEAVAGSLGGPPARALVYKMLVGEYLYQARHLDGTLNLARLPESELAGGWSEPHRRPEGPGFRWAYHPEACLRLPFETPIDLRLAITGRAPAGTQPQTLELRMNGVRIGAARLGRDWEVLRFEAPARFLIPGENRLCLSFDHALPSESGRGVAAAIARVQLP